jgi:hypothetical protein
MLNQATKGAAEARRQSVQWQIVELKGTPDASYRTFAQKQPPVSIIGPSV